MSQNYVNEMLKSIKNILFIVYICFLSIKYTASRNKNVFQRFIMVIICQSSNYNLFEVKNVSYREVC